MELHPYFNSNVDVQAPLVVNLRCPQCGKEGAFHGIPNIADAKWMQPRTLEEKNRNVATSMAGGIRRCPNTKCNAVVFVVTTMGEVVKSYPAEILDFNSANLPEGVKNCLEEAVLCHANRCYKASSLMVRRTLEELCANQEAKGGNLEKRIDALKSKIVVPEKLFTAMHELRFLGNDAAHVEAREYDEVGEPQARVAIRLTQELLKAVYQLDDLVKELTDLKGQ